MTTTKTARQLRTEAQRARLLADELLSQAVEAERAELDAQRPAQPDIPGAGCAVVCFTKVDSFGRQGHHHNYAAVGWRVGGGKLAEVAAEAGEDDRRWAVTGKEGGRMTWTALTDFIGRDNWHSMRLVNSVCPL